MRRKILGILGVIAICCVSMGTGMMTQPVWAVDPGPSTGEGTKVDGEGSGSCGGSFLGFKPWHDGLCSGGEVKQVNNDSELTTFIWTIVLNISFDLSLAAGYLAVGLVIYSGYLYMMSQGDPGKAAKGKKSLTNAIIGLIIAMGATVIVNTAKTVLKIGEDAASTPQYVQDALNWVYSMAGIVAVIFIIKSGIDYMTSAGNPGKTSKATQGLIMSIVGLIIVILAGVITAFVVNTISGAM